MGFISNSSLRAAKAAEQEARNAAAAARNAAAAAGAEYMGIWNGEGCEGRIYGVRFALTGSTEGTRTGAAVGMTAGVSTDTVSAENDFDAVPMFNFTRVNGYVTEDGEFVETATVGDMNFALDGSNGDVYSRFKTSFYREIVTETYREIQLTDRPTAYNVDTLGPWYTFDIFIRPDGTLRPYAYIAAYEAAFNESNAFLGSISGKTAAHSAWGNSGQGGMSQTLQLTELRRKGTQYCGMTIKEIFFLQTLFSVEFATLDAQSVMKGAVSMTAHAKCTTGETDSPRIIISTEDAAEFPIGCAVSIGTGAELNRDNADAHSIAESVRVIGKTGIDSANTALELEESITTTTNTYVTIMPWHTGSTDNVRGSSGSPVSNTSGQYPMLYRGVENLYGNTWNIVSDVIISDYVPYICYDCTVFTENVSDSYQRAAYTLAKTSGSIKELGCDKNHPSVRLPINSNGTSNRYYADYYRTAVGQNRGLLYGGSLRNNSEGGLWAYSAEYPVNKASSEFAARISACGRCGAAPKK